MPVPPQSSPRSPSAFAEMSGTILEQRYELGEALGAGGMGAVFHARHLRLDRQVAIKVLRPVFVGHDEYIKRFLREAKAASKIRHRNVVEILDYGEAAGGLVYSVMEFLVGQDLERLLRSQPNKQLPWSRACGLLVQIASGLRAAHSCGVIHRDIKPANCFLTEEDGEPLVKLVDFGIAKVDDADQTQQLTGTAQVLGTPAYIAPELVRTKTPANPRSDIYSLGVVAYRMLAGHVPFAAETVFELLHRSCFEPVPPLRQFVPEVPPEVEAFILELLAKKPEDRPADMQTVRERLLALSGEAGGPQPVVVAPSSALSGALPEGRSALTQRSTIPHDVPPIAPPVLEPPAAENTTAVQLEPRPSHIGRPSPRPPSAPPRVVVAPASEPAPARPPEPRPNLSPNLSPNPVPAAAAPMSIPASTSTPARPLVPTSTLPSMHEPAAISSLTRSSETVPAIGESTLRMGDSTSLDRPPRNAAAAWVLGGLVAAVAVGIGGWSMLSSNDEPAAPAAEPQAKAVIASPPQPAEPVGSTETRAPAPPSEQTQDRPPPASTRAQPIEAPASVETTPDAPPTEPSSSDVPTPTGSTSTSPPRKPTKPKARTPTKSSGPPSDSSVIKKLVRKIESKCASAMQGKPVTVSFLVGSNGKPLGINTSPRGEAGQCAAQRVKGTEFRTRSSATPIKFTVK